MRINTEGIDRQIGLYREDGASDQDLGLIRELLTEIQIINETNADVGASLGIDLDLYEAALPSGTPVFEAIQYLRGSASGKVCHFATVLNALTIKHVVVVPPHSAGLFRHEWMVNASTLRKNLKTIAFYGRDAILHGSIKRLVS